MITYNTRLLNRVQLSIYSTRASVLCGFEVQVKMYRSFFLLNESSSNSSRMFDIEVLLLSISPLLHTGILVYRLLETKLIVYSPSFPVG